MKNSQTIPILMAALALAVVAVWSPAAHAQVPTISSQKDGFVSAQPDNPSADLPSAGVLWDQPRSVSNTGAYVNQVFSDYPDYSSTLADDFTNTETWNVSAIFVPGDGWNNFSSLYNATWLGWSICADNNGQPDCIPGGGGNTPLWSITLAPTDAQVTITTGSPGGYPSNTQLDLATPVALPPGTWWLMFVPNISFDSYGQFGRQVSDTVNGAQAQFINPGGGFGYGTSWQSITVLSPTQTDLAFRLEGDAGCETDNECDDGLFCTGVETCDNGTCVATGDPCGEGSPVCDEDNGTCVECLTDDNCTEGQFCDEGVCRFPCELFIKYKEIRAEKLTKDRKWVFTVTGEEDFDLFGLIDLGPITWEKVKFSKKKNMLKIKAIVPAGLAPGSYPVSVGECSGEIVVIGNDL